MSTHFSTGGDPQQIDDFDVDLPASPMDEQAASWLIRLTSGAATAEDRAAFVQWRDADPEHEVALSRLRAVWGALPTIDAPSQAMSSAHGGTRVVRPLRRRAWRAWGLAASLLASAGLAYQLQTHWRHDSVTAAGERRSIELDDGSMVLMSSGTALDVAFDESERRIRLARGEAYFDVRTDTDRPFIVEAGHAQVQVVGTRFAVQRTASTGAVTVVEGRVRVSTEGGGVVMLEADQRVRFDASEITETERVDAVEVLAWRQGRLIVNAATLDEITALINRYRGGTIVVRVDAERQKPINAVIDLDHVDAWLDALAGQGQVRVARLGPLTLLY